MGKFSDKAKGILDNKANGKMVASMTDFIRDEQNNTDLCKSSNTDIQNNINTDIKINHKTREEFVFPAELSEKLAAAAYFGKTKKVKIVIDALEKYFTENPQKLIRN